MSKTAKRILIAVLVLALAGGGAAAGILIARNNQDPVKVYNLQELAVTDYWGDRQTYYGPVTTDRIQPVHVSDTQIVRAILVQDGQEVKKGDPLLSYDSTLTELNIAAKEIEIQQKQMELERNEKEYEQLKTYKPGVDIPENGYDPGMDSLALEVQAAHAEAPADVETAEGVKTASLEGKLYVPAVGDPTDESSSEDSGEETSPEGGSTEESTPEDSTEESTPEDSTEESASEELTTEEPTTEEPTTEAPTTEAPTTEAPTTEEPTTEEPTTEEPTTEEPTTEEPTTEEPTTEEPTTEAKQVAYRVIFKANHPEAAGTMKVLTVYEGETGKLPANAFTVEGFDFAGWNTKKDGSGTAYADGAKLKEAPKDAQGNAVEKLVLYAQWTEARPEFPQLVQGKGTEKDPYIYLWRSDDVISAKMLNYLIGTRRVNKVRQANVILMSRDGDLLEGMHTGSLTFTLTEKDGEIVMQPTGFLTFDQDPIAPPEPDPEPDPDPGPWPDPYIPGTSYTAAELARFKADKELKINDIKLELQGMNLELDNMKEEFANDTVKAEIDGVVKNVTDPDTALSEGTPVLMVSGGGGYYVECTIGELALNKLSIGQGATIMSWNTGSQVEGTVCEISAFPTEDQNYWGGGNTNVSNYPFKIFVDEDANLEEGEYVEVTLEQTEQQGGGLYLMNAFVRTVDGKSFVMAQGADGKLEKRPVVTGAALWGEYTQISGDVSVTDKIAFPYGDAVEGAPTEEGSMEDLYASMYAAY